MVKITYLIFIIPVNDDETEYRIFDIYSVITDTLIHLGINEDWIPDFAIYYILPKESLSYKKVKTILSQLSKSDKW